MKKYGFTLAEVLITLVVIGIVAAITVPMMLNNTNASEFRSALKKAISGLNRALVMNYSLDGSSAADYSTAEEVVTDIFKKRMNTIDGDTSHTFDGQCSASENARFTTSDGAMYCIQDFQSDPNKEDINNSSVCDANNKNVCGDSSQPQIIIDVNGVKKPNKLTARATRPRDIYLAQLYAQRVIPYGQATQSVMAQGSIEYSKKGTTDEEPTVNRPEDSEDNEQGGDAH